MRGRLPATWCLALGALLAAPAADAIPFFDDSDIITATDPTTFVGATYAGMGLRNIYDRRGDAFVWTNAFLFDAMFSDGLELEIQLNPEFGSEAEARVAAETWAFMIGQLPRALRELLTNVAIHQGDYAFGGGNGGLLIYADAEYIFENDLAEETLVHEAAHSLHDPHGLSDGWQDAQEADNGFVSDYAAAFPDREDIPETFLRWFAVRYKLDRITPEYESFILGAVPNRLAYFDAQNFDVFPVPEPATTVLLLTGVSVVAGRIRLRRPHERSRHGMRFSVRSSPG
jgi:hypothetical protein